MQVYVFVCILHSAWALICQEEMVYSKPYGYVYSIACRELNDTNLRELKNILTQHKVKLILDHSVLTKFSSSVFKTIPNTVELIVKSSDVSKLDFLPRTLTRLSLVNNSLITIEANFSNLDELRAVNFSYNNLSALPHGVLRPTIEELNLSYNELEKFDVTCGVTRLKRLYLSHNRIQTLNGFPFKCLPILDQLHLDYNNITQLPSLKALSYVTKLIVNDNAISEVSDAFLGMENLMVLNLAGNKIIRVDGVYFQDTRQLQSLYLQRNRIEGIILISSKILELNLEDNNFTKVNLTVDAVKKLHLSHNRINSFNFGNFSNLTHLFLRNCSLAALAGRLRTLFKLEILDLSFNALDLQKNDFEDLQNLQELDLSANALRFLPPSIFSSQSHLEKLNLSHNHLKEFVDLDLVELRVLDLSYNLFEYVDERMLKFLSNLEKLYVNHNRLKFIEYNLIVNYLREIEVFDIRDNQFPCQFLVDMVKYLNVSQISFGYTEKTLDFDENVAGVRCQETVSNGSARVSLALAIAGLLVLFLVFVTYRYYLVLVKNRRFIEEVELIANSDKQFGEIEEFWLVKKGFIDVFSVDHFFRYHNHKSMTIFISYNVSR
ncbi:hypothetical protein FQR65_LT04847 [Abscondita terminalis]|nr:hypothetical protein FQR65_LT04847 [Abscondita terminalis]